MGRGMTRMGSLWLCQNSYWTWSSISWFTYQKWWFSIVMLVYQRVFEKTTTQASHGKKIIDSMWILCLSGLVLCLSTPIAADFFPIKFSISETLVYIIEVYIPQVFAPVTSCNYCNVTQCLYLPFLVRGWVVYYRFIDIVWLVVHQLLGKMMEFVSWDDEIPNWMDK